MPRRSVEISGLSQLTRRLAALPKACTREVGTEIRTKIGPDALSEMVRNAPVDEGTLRGSHSLHFDGRRTMTGADLGETGPGATPLDGGAETGPTSAAIAANTVYAMYQHETLELQHPKGGEAKWMERALDRRRAQYERRIGDAVKRGIALETRG